MAEVHRLRELGKSAFAEGRYQDAHEAFASAANAATRIGSPYDAAMNWSNAGYSALAGMQYRPALENLLRARSIAEKSGEMKPLIFALNNLASLYLQMNQPANALRIAEDALSGPAGHADAAKRGQLLLQQARALAGLDRFSEAEPIFRQAMKEMTDAGDFAGAAGGWAIFGDKCIDSQEYAHAEAALKESLRLSATWHLKTTAYPLTDLAKLRGKNGDPATAERLFHQALDAHESLTPLWVIYYERGLFRLEAGRNAEALADFRQARKFAMLMRADMVPSDQDRAALEQVGEIFEGFVDAGNRLALSNRDNAVLAETFDVAEKDRMWSLRALIPETNDWRSRLPARYWDLLVRFQATERELLAEPPASNQRVNVERQAADLELELRQIEASAGAGSQTAAESNNTSPSAHVKSVLDSDSVLFSFSIAKRSSWLWTVDRKHIAVYALPAHDQVEREVAAFRKALLEGRDITVGGRLLYSSLFGSVPAATLAHKRWLIEPDGPLYELPFAALPIGEGKNGGRPDYLIERAALQTIPGALLVERGAVQTAGSFVGIGDPVFNTADSRYSGRRWKTSRTAVMLPRLANTGPEIDACSRAWGAASPRLLKGPAANIGVVESALSNSPAAIHFATHVVAGSDEYQSGLIALGLDANGAMGLLGPKDIVARRLPGSLVVMDGCHSGQGKALPGSGLMGLTRAWIGAGASAVLSTGWDIPDDAAQSLMVNFYQEVHNAAGVNPAAALRAAQLAALHSEGPDRQPLRWAGYFLLSRI
jgi:CHAT domain-containing protein/tetratricopeptide (TPR) repeat protein